MPCEDCLSKESFDRAMLGIHGTNGVYGRLEETGRIALEAHKQAEMCFESLNGTLDKSGFVTRLNKAEEELKRLTGAGMTVVRWVGTVLMAAFSAYLGARFG